MDGTRRLASTWPRRNLQSHPPDARKTSAPVYNSAINSLARSCIVFPLLRFSLTQLTYWFPCPKIYSGQSKGHIAFFGATPCFLHDSTELVLLFSPSANFLATHSKALCHSRNIVFLPQGIQHLYFHLNCKTVSLFHF